MIRMSAVNEFIQMSNNNDVSKSDINDKYENKLLMTWSDTSKKVSWSADNNRQENLAVNDMVR